MEQHNQKTPQPGNTTKLTERTKEYQRTNDRHTRHDLGKQH